MGPFPLLPLVPFPLFPRVSFPLLPLVLARPQLASTPRAVAEVDFDHGPGFDGPGNKRPSTRELTSWPTNGPWGYTVRFIATLTHSPESCWTRTEHRGRAREWIASIDDRADEHGVELVGAYVTPTEHTFYVIVEADDYEDVTRFLGPPLLHDHEGHIAPILTLKESAAAFEDRTE